MNYWLICLPREDIEHCVAIGVFGLSRKHTISQVLNGDKVACLVTREKDWKVIALGEAVSDYYIDDKTVFKKPGIFVDRFDLRAQRLKPEVSFTPFIEKMSFITKPAYWPVYFKNSIVKLSANDWQQIETAARTMAKKDLH